MGPEADSITMLSATSPQAISIRAISNRSPGEALLIVSQLLVDADTLCGGKCSDKELELYAKMVIGNFQHRSVESLALALREGLSRTDKDGKVYGKLSWPTIMEWLSTHENKIMDSVWASHPEEPNDQLGKEWLDRLEKQAGAKDRKLDMQQRIIDKLRKKLDGSAPAKTK